MFFSRKEDQTVFRLILAGLLLLATAFGAAAAISDGHKGDVRSVRAEGAPIVLAAGPCNPRVRVCE